MHTLTFPSTDTKTRCASEIGTHVRLLYSLLYRDKSLVRNGKRKEGKGGGGEGGGKDIKDKEKMKVRKGQERWHAQMTVTYTYTYIFNPL